MLNTTILLSALTNCGIVEYDKVQAVNRFVNNGPSESSELTDKITEQFLKILFQLWKDNKLLSKSVYTEAHLIETFGSKIEVSQIINNDRITHYALRGIKDRSFSSIQSPSRIPEVQLDMIITSVGSNVNARALITFATDYQEIPFSVITGLFGNGWKSGPFTMNPHQAVKPITGNHGNETITYENISQSLVKKATITFKGNGTLESCDFSEEVK